MSAFRYGETENPTQRSFQTRIYIYPQKEKFRDKGRLPSMMLARAWFFSNPCFLQSTLTSSSWSWSFPPRYKVAARNNDLLFKEGGRTPLDITSNPSSRFCSQNLVTYPFPNQFLEPGNAFPFNYSSPGLVPPLVFGYVGDRRGFEQNRGSVRGRGSNAN